LQHCFKSIPLHQVFLETDEAPIAIDTLYETAANLLQTEIENVILPIQENFKRVFKLA
jgi:Tat protein secretion system quality control protein TatD with DNase activity